MVLIRRSSFAGKLSSPSLRIRDFYDIMTRSAIQATIARYANVRYNDRQYVRFKLLTDPLTSELTRYDAEWGDVVDAGCGRGQFGLLLHDLGRVRSLFGYDWDAAKIASATRAGGSVGRFQTADFRNPP